MTTPRAVRSEIENFLDYLIHNDLALYCNPVVEYHGGSLSWPIPSGRPAFLTARGAHTTSEYSHWLTHSMYSALLRDGSLLQVSYEVSGGQVTGHRLAWVPPPFEFDLDLLESEATLDLLEIYLDAGEELQLRSPIRFDFDPDAATEAHPASHFTMNGPSCRVECIGPLRLGRFVEFVFTHFYSDLWDDHEYLRALPKDPYDKPEPPNAPRKGIHLAWAS